jgi:hypothetical protein
VNKSSTVELYPFRRTENQQAMLKRRIGEMVVGVSFQLHSSKVNYNYVCSLSGHSFDFRKLQTNFYGVLNQRGFRAASLWINRARRGLAALYQATGWRFGGLQEHFYFRAVRRDFAYGHRVFSSFRERDH